MTLRLAHISYKADCRNQMIFNPLSVRINSCRN